MGAAQVGAVKKVLNRTSAAVFIGVNVYSIGSSEGDRTVFAPARVSVELVVSTPH